jgi:hypothetical protein
LNFYPIPAWPEMGKILWKPSEEDFSDPFACLPVPQRDGFSLGPFPIQYILEGLRTHIWLGRRWVKEDWLITQNWPSHK